MAPREGGARWLASLGILTPEHGQASVSPTIQEEGLGYARVPPPWRASRGRWTWPSPQPPAPPPPSHRVRQGNEQKTGLPRATAPGPGRAGLVCRLLGRAPGTLLQSLRPSRQRQLLQSSTQELPCGKGMPCDQQDLPNTITMGRGGGVSCGHRAQESRLPLPACTVPAQSSVPPQPTVLAPRASPAWWAGAAVAIDLVHTCGSVSTG